MSQGNVHSQKLQIKIKQGLAADINTTITKNLAVVGEPHWTTDTKQLYIFDGVQNVRVPTADSTGRITFGGSANYAEVKADGEINLYGTARTTNDVWIDAGAIKAPGSKPATEIAHGTLETPAWQFANQAVAGNQETVCWNMRVPNRMDRSVAPAITIGVSTTTIFTDDAVDNETIAFQLEYLWTAVNEDTSAAAQETLSASHALAAVTVAEGLVLITFTGIDVPSATDACLHCRLTRLSATTDTVADTIELHGVCLSFTSNKLGAAT